jgi:hypothetical protein
VEFRVERYEDKDIAGVLRQDHRFEEINII